MLNTTNPFETSEKLLVGFVATPVDISKAYLLSVRADYATGSCVRIGESLFSCRTLLASLNFGGGMRDIC